jgi:hypothetical protein
VKSLWEGPDTTTRLQTVWQVKLLKVGETSPPDQSHLQLQNAVRGFRQMNTASNRKTDAPHPAVAPETIHACCRRQRATTARNQLYRVEIHTGGFMDQATFKWSRDNGSVETKIKKIAAAC